MDRAKLLKTDKWKPLRYHPVQAQLWDFRGRFACVVAGRRSGKTDICRKKLILQLPIKKPWEDPEYYYVFPTREQAKRVVWYDFLRLIPSNWYDKKTGLNRSELSITTLFGSKLYIVGADKPHRLEGRPADGVVIDESCDQKPGLYGLTIVPMLTERNGWCYRIGVPKRFGVGRIEFRECYNKGMRGEDGITSFFWKSSEILTPEQIAEAKSQQSEVDFEEQFEAKWLDIGSSVYHAFHQKNITHENTNYNPVYPIHVGCDFNVNPMCWTLSHRINNKLFTFDELFIRNTHTQAVLDILYNKYHTHGAGWSFYGDASGRARKTSSVVTDFLIIKNDARFGQKQVYFPHKNPHIRDRFAAVNRAFKAADGTVSIFINPRCKHLINDFNTVSFIEGTSEVEDYDGTDIKHMSDSFGYKVYLLMPIRLERTEIPIVHSLAS